MAILESDKSVDMTQREVAVVVAQAISRAGLPQPNGRFRNDVDHIQIDPVIIERRVTSREPGVRLQFMAANELGVTLNINLREFSEDPKGYLTNLLEHLNPMLRNSLKMRKRKEIINQAMYEIMTEEAAANG
jgi:hypothetical protein